MVQSVRCSPAGSALTYPQGALLVLLSGVVWSTLGLGIRSMEAVNVWQVLLYRSCALIPFLLLVIALTSAGRPLAAIRSAGPVAALGGIALVLANAGGIYAIQTTSVANTIFLFASAPFLAALLGRLLLGEAVRRRTGLAMALALAGIAIMVTEGISLGHGVGNLAALASALGFALFTIVLRWGRQANMLPAVLWSGVFSILVATAVCLAEGHSLAISRHDTVIALLLGAFQLGLGLALYTVGSKVVPAAEMTLLCLSEVLLAPVWVWLFLGETVALYTLLGGAVLIAAIAVNALTGLKRPQPPIF